MKMRPRLWDHMHVTPLPLDGDRDEMVRAVGGRRQAFTRQHSKTPGRAIATTACNASNLGGTARERAFDGRVWTRAAAPWQSRT